MTQEGGSVSAAPVPSRPGFSQGTESPTCLAGPQHLRGQPGPAVLLTLGRMAGPLAAGATSSCKPVPGPGPLYTGFCWGLSQAERARLRAQTLLTLERKGRGKGMERLLEFHPSLRAPGHTQGEKPRECVRDGTQDPLVTWSLELPPFFDDR